MQMNAVEFLETLLRIPSLSGQEGEAAAFLTARMREFGWYAFVDAAGNAVGQLGTTGPLVVLLGHIDTVPGMIPVRIQDGCLYGRGAVDAKGPFATFVQAARHLELTGRLRCRLVLIGATEEESASSRGAHYAREQYAPTSCIIGEPSGWDRVTLGYKGRLLVHYHLEQDAAHSAGEQPAAPQVMVAFWRELEAYCATVNVGRDRLFEQLLPSLRHVASGGDGMSDWCEATIGLRLPEGVDPDALASHVASLAGSARLRFEGGCPAFRSPRTTPLAGAFVRAIRQHGGQPGFLHKTGTADMNVVGPAWRCPIVAYGPGDSRLDHTPDEHLDLEEYQRAILVLADVLAQQV
ncbi:[LysW]-lysine hydrolase [Candidatus Chloroploca sp. M-50]|uniref:Putative [LysW]-lysine hydrolase n=1 Tax=Candidatus Chloroploca mongolica TaxID=2528176 RepID=A0ABS4DC52_9CHLR|nr:[LysW]-lysine hydrolase [Candidatus Chloroploca mongolica]MBP1467021.1 [LysW]-lysine hydrolase [Candidatus Chloroploca mongolica]